MNKKISHHKNRKRLIIPLLFLIFLVIITSLTSCKRSKTTEKGFSVNPETETSTLTEADGLENDSTLLKTRPGSVLLTAFPEYRITSIFKLNYNKRGDYYYTGSNSYYRNYAEITHTRGNQWHYNFMPGLQAVYGYNMVNVSVGNTQDQSQKLLFEKPVLIKTLYLPSFTQDTLLNQPVKRNYYLISVYDEDTNKDGLINLEDLRRFYHFNLEGTNKSRLIPQNYSVISSEYDWANDYMYVYAQQDANQNGQRDATEAIHIFWIDLKNPANNGIHYQ